MIFLVQVQRPQIALALRARAILWVFDKFIRAYLFQIVPEIMWLPMQRYKYKNCVLQGHFVCACSVWDDLMKVAADVRLQSALTRLFPAYFRPKSSHKAKR